MERNAFLISKKFNQYLVPGVMMTVALQLGNIVDSMIVGSLLGPNAMAAITVSVPILYALQMIPLMLAKGGALEASVFLGRRDMKSANGIFTTTLLAGLVLAVPITMLAPFLSKPAAVLLAANEELVVYAEPYILIHFLGYPIAQILNCSFCFFMNTDNHLKLGSLLLVISNVVNLILDFVLIKFFHLGIAGSALSTIIGNVVGLVAVIPYMRSKDRTLRLQKPDKAFFSYLRLIVKAGIPSAALQMVKLLQFFIVNSFIVRVLGNDSMAVYSICNSAIRLAKLCVNGIIELLHSMAGILFGERDYYGIRALCRKILSYSYIVIAGLMVLLLAAPGAIAAMYGVTQGDMLSSTETALRIISLEFVFYVLNIFLITYYQTILQTKFSSFITVLQGCVVSIPLVLAGLFIWGIYGVCIMMVLSEALTVLFAALWRVRQQKRGKLPPGGIYMLPKVTDEKSLDCSVQNSLDDVISFRDRLLAFCEENQITKRDAEVLGLAVEEIAANIVQYGYKNSKKYYMDICFLIQDDKYILRFRDDGIPFNPMEYEPQSKEPVIVGGISLIKKMTSKFEYMRVLNMNNTVIELNITRHIVPKAAY